VCVIDPADKLKHCDVCVLLRYQNIFRPDLVV
jgi:hypothetical protein